MGDPVDVSPADAESAELRHRIGELEAVIDAIRSGGVDAVVTGPPGEERIYTLSSADRPYRAIIEDMDDAAMTVSPTGTILFVNPCLAHLTARDRSRLVGTRVTDLFAGIDQFTLHRLLSLRPGEHDRAEMHLSTPQGPIPVVVVANCIDVEGLAVHCLIATDISARKRAENDLQQREEELRASIESMIDGFVLLASVRDGAGDLVDFRLRHVNDAACRLYERPREVLLGLTIGDAGLPGWLRRLTPDLIGVVNTGVPITVSAVQRSEVRGDDGQMLSRILDLRAAALGDGIAMTMQDVTARTQVADALEYRTLHDPLTGLANRTLVTDHLELAVRGLSRGAAPVAVLYVDLDGFKEVNDTHSHEVGDEVLCMAADRIRAVLRPGDTAARMGGDEFVVICPGITSEADLARIGGRLVVTLGEALAVGNLRIRIGASVGGTLTSDPSADVSELIFQADQAMYAAKRHGGRGYELHAALRPRRPRSAS